MYVIYVYNMKQAIREDRGSKNQYDNLERCRDVYKTSVLFMI